MSDESGGVHKGQGSRGDVSDGIHKGQRGDRSEGSGGWWGMDVGVIDDGLEPVLRRSVAAVRSVERVRLGRIHTGLVPGPDLSPLQLVSRQSWDEMWEGATPRRNWTFGFMTPTTFRSQNRYQPLPVANSVFGHLWRAWQLHGPQAPDLNLKEVSILVEAFEGKTETMELRRRAVPGFVGWVTYRADGVDDESARMIDRCARLAPFAGVGSHTTTGFGVVDLW